MSAAESTISYLQESFTHAAESYEHGILLMLNDGRVDAARHCALDAWTAREAAKSAEPLRMNEQLFALRDAEPRGLDVSLCSGAADLLHDARRLLVHVIGASHAAKRQEGTGPEAALDYLDRALDALDAEDLEAQGPKKPTLRLIVDNT